MKGPLGELNPSRAVARRMHELEAELQQARMHLRRYSKSPETTGRWGLEQPSAPQQEEGWFITYLDMMTLLLVVMIVMLAFSGSLGERGGPAADSGRHAAVMAAADSGASRSTPSAGTPARSDTARTDTAGEPSAAAEPAATSRALEAPAETATAGDPAASGPAAPAMPPAGADAAQEASPTPTQQPDGSGLLPAGAGLLPGHGNAIDTAAISQTYPGWTPRTGAPAHPADIGPLPRDAPVATGAGADRPARARRGSAELYPGWSAADLAASFIGPPLPITRAAPSGADDTSTGAESTTPAPADDPPSEGEMLAAGLALGELGSDVEIIVSERSVSLRVNSEILFDSSQADLSRSGLSVLRNIVKALTRAGYDITVEGHTDAVPVRRNVRYPSNWELSSARAGSVVRYLQANGIDRSRLKAVGYADTRPIADNHTPEGRARNRRVELVIEKRE